MPRVLMIVVACVALGLLMTAWAFFEGHDLQGIAIHSVSGQLMAYEPSRQDLTLRTNSGDRHFSLRDGTRVHEGATALNLADLVSARGCPAKVWYRDTGGSWVGSDVRISCRRIVPHADPNSS